MSELPKSTLGRTGLEVTKLGYGAMELRGIDHFPRLSAGEASAILNSILDNGINYIDTSPDYGYSEELIGRHIAHRRDEYFLASKCGCPIEAPDVAHSNRQPHSFTRQNIRAGVEQSLDRMKTDYLDVVPGVDPACHRVRSASLVLPKETPFHSGVGDALEMKPGVAHLGV